MPKHHEVTITVKVSRWYRLRLWTAVQLVKLSAWLMSATVTVTVTEVAKPKEDEAHVE